MGDVIAEEPPGLLVAESPLAIPIRSSQKGCRLNRSQPV
jgi:hypothetical protein